MPATTVSTCRADRPRRPPGAGFEPPVARVEAKSPSVAADPFAPDPRFCTTRWTVVRTAGNVEGPQAADALDELCRRYWYPLYAYVRRRGHSAEDAQDLTQGFFAQLIAKNYVGQADRFRGRFRTFLLGALDHYLADQWDRARRLKRGGGQPVWSFDAVSAEVRYRLEPVDRLDASHLFDRRWATTLLDHALGQLEEEFRREGRSVQFGELQPLLVGAEGLATYASTAVRLGTTVAALKMAVSRLRRRYRELLREEIVRTVATAEAAESEYQALLEVLRR